jgi:hypothetical protein
MQGFHFVTLRKLCLIADPTFVSLFTASQFENTTPYKANNVQHIITVLGVVMSLFVGKWT